MSKNIFYKKRNLRKCENYRTLSIITHSSKVLRLLLRLILDRLNPQLNLSQLRVYFPMIKQDFVSASARLNKFSAACSSILFCRILLEIFCSKPPVNINVKHLEIYKKSCHNFTAFILRFLQF